MHCDIFKVVGLTVGMTMAGQGLAFTLPDRGGDEPPANTPESCPTELPDILPQGSTDFWQKKPGVPAGNVEQVRADGNRFHIYTPPGYDSADSEQYPVLYLLHGAGQDDSNWTSRAEDWGGSADLILDNMLAEGRIEPMIVVMPDTSSCASMMPGRPGVGGGCTDLFTDTLMPYVESHYNVIADRDHRAIAGLSQGGFVVFNTGFARLDLFSHLFSYGSGWFSSAQRTFERNFSSVLEDPETNSLLNTPLYMAAGDDDIAYGNTQATLEILKDNGIITLTQQHEGGHDMDSFRRHLHQTLPMMFVNEEGCGS